MLYLVNKKNRVIYIMEAGGIEPPSYVWFVNLFLNLFAASPEPPVPGINNLIAMRLILRPHIL